MRLFVALLPLAGCVEDLPPREYQTYVVGDPDPGPGDEWGDPYLCDRALGDAGRAGDAPFDTLGFPGDLTPQELSALDHIFPDATSVERRSSGDVEYFEGYDGIGLGTAFVGEGWGWGGTLVTFTGVDPEDVTLRVELVYADVMEWTWGVGPAWMAQFQCMDLEQIDVATRDWGPYPIDGVTGATITSQAIIQSVWQALERHEAVFP